jgi:hypothetical protein
MNFPIYDISDFSWNNYRIKEHNVLYENPYSGFAPRNKGKFLERIKKFKFIDPDGVIYKAKGFIIHPKKGLSRFFSLTYKIEIEFIGTNELYTLEEFKELLIKRARETKNLKLEKIASSANSFDDILRQFT